MYLNTPPCLPGYVLFLSSKSDKVLFTHNTEEAGKALRHIEQSDMVCKVMTLY